MILVNIIHEDNLLRLGIRQALKDQPEIQVMHEASTGNAGLLAVQKLSPDVVILGLKLADMPGAEIIPQLMNFQPAPKLLMISIYPQQVTPSQLISMGVSGCVTSLATPEELCSAVKTVSTGQTFFSDHNAQYLKSSQNMHSGLPPEQELTSREKTVLTLLVEGKTVAEIADQISVSHKTVHSYRDRIFQKLGVLNDIQLVLTAIKRGLISIN